MVTVVVIIANSIILCLFNPLDPGNRTMRNIVVDRSAMVFTAFFTVEMSVKVLALGLWGPGTYFNDRWNWYDEDCTATTMI
jgi:voltage-dependent calcium channel T type alpha-1G